MRNNSYAHLAAVVLLASLTAAAAVADDDAQDRNELVVFGGISLLDASRTRETSFDGSIELPGFGGRPGRPITIPALSFETESSLGTSVLFGARYSRRIKDRLALEADLAVAPNHELETGVGGGCFAGFCFGSGSGRGNVDGRAILSLADRNVTAWHYGAGLAYEVMGGDVRPLVLLGAGAATWDGAREASTSFELRFGLGLKVLFGRVGARIDVVDHLVLDHFVSGDAEHDVHATAGLLVRF
jgi:hypothetical protein